MRSQERLWTACADGDVATVRTLLESGDVDINGVSEYGKTALHYASSMGKLPVVELLLEAGADLHATSKDGWTPLHNASSNGHLEVVELLLKSGADPNAAYEPFRHTPLHRACYRHQSDVTRVLLASGADLNAKDSTGREPLHSCLRNRLFYSFTDETLEMLQVLVSYGATWDVTCDEMVAKSEALQEAPVLRICLSLWALEFAAGRPFTDVPVETIRRGAQSTQSYIDALKTSREIVFRRKICLVGTSCAGKTSLIKSITTKQPQLVHVDDRTIGIDHFPLRFIESTNGDEKTKVHKVTFWDFAGQDAYQVAHSLFFSPRTLFLVCVDLEAFTTAVLQASIMAHAQKQEMQLMDEFIERTVLRWIRLIVARQPDAEFVFIATKDDLLAENKATAQLFKTTIKAKLKEVQATVQRIRDELEKNKRLAAEAGEKSSESGEPNLTTGQWDEPTLSPATAVDVATPEPTIVFVSCASYLSVQAARTRIEELIIQSKRSFQMPDTYSQALDAIVEMRAAANTNDITKRINCVFAPLDALPAKLQIEPELCRTILQTLHDLGDVLWFEDLGVELFKNTVILDPLLLIDFIRQVINHTHTGVTMSHADLKSKPFWMGLSSETQLKAMKQVLHKFRLVYPDAEDRIMEWDSDLIVPAWWQTKTPASWLFLGDILRINASKSCAGEAVRVDWEYHFEFGLPSSLFDQVVVASVSPDIKFEAGPDWIVYEEKGVAACRVMVGRDVQSLHRTIHVEAVVAQAADDDQVDELWWSFQHLCGAFITVMREYPGLAGVSSFAWDDKHTKMNLKRLVQSTRPPKKSAAKWMPPAETWAWYKEIVTKSV